MDQDLLKPTAHKIIIFVFLLLPIFLGMNYVIYSVGRELEAWTCSNQINECLPSQFPLMNLSFGEFISSLYGIIIFVVTAVPVYVMACFLSSKYWK